MGALPPAPGAQNRRPDATVLQITWFSDMSEAQAPPSQKSHFYGHVVCLTGANPTPHFPLGKIYILERGPYHFPTQHRPEPTTPNPTAPIYISIGPSRPTLTNRLGHLITGNPAPPPVLQIHQLPGKGPTGP
jgi:hypothetical protein